MKLPMSGALVALCLVLSGCATAYNSGNAGGIIGGQKITRLGPTNWRVRSLANGFTAPEFGRNVAIYKAAMLTVAAGYTHFQIYKFEIVGVRGQYERATMYFDTVNDPDPPFRCESQTFRDNCRTLSAREAIVYYAPRIPQTAAQAAAEVEQMRVRYGFGPAPRTRAPAEPQGKPTIG